MSCPISSRVCTAAGIILICAMLVKSEEDHHPAHPVSKPHSDAPHHANDQYDLPSDNTDWTLDEISGYYWSETAGLFFDRASGHFYDPASEQWFDPEKEEWYQSEHHEEPGLAAESDESSAANGAAADTSNEEDVTVEGAAENAATELWDLPTDHTDWRLDHENDLYWSETAQLYFDRSSGHFYDPASEQWYDSEKEVWYIKEAK